MRVFFGSQQIKSDVAKSVRAVLRARMQWKRMGWMG